MADGFTNTHTTLPHNKWTEVERRVCKVLEKYGCWAGRSIGIGLSDTALAWTDGSSYIILERSYLRRRLGNPSNIAHLFGTLVHELSHDDDDRGTHVHGDAFDRRFREICEQYRSPMMYIAHFYNDMRRQRIDDRQAKVIAKEQAAQAKLEAKLTAAPKKQKRAAARSKKDDNAAVVIAAAGEAVADVTTVKVSKPPRKKKVHGHRKVRL